MDRDELAPLPFFRLVHQQLSYLEIASLGNVELCHFSPNAVWTQDNETSSCCCYCCNTSDPILWGIWTTRMCALAAHYASQQSQNTSCQSVQPVFHCGYQLFPLSQFQSTKLVHIPSDPLGQQKLALGQGNNKKMHNKNLFLSLISPLWIIADLQQQ